VNKEEMDDPMGMRVGPFDSARQEESSGIGFVMIVQTVESQLMEYESG
jgi:hypothetical protein